MRGSSATGPTKRHDRAESDTLAPERRLEAIADIVARGLARVLLAEESRSRDVDAHAPQLSANTAESALIDAPSEALMVERGDVAAANEGGRTR